MDKRFSINEQNGVNYLATICKVGEVFPIEGADRLVKTVINGFDIVISKDHKPGDIVVYFPVETSICEQYLSANNLYEMGEFERNSNAEDVKNILIKSESLPDDDTEGKLALLNEAKSKCGFFNKHGRVRILKLRGQYSQGFIATVDTIVNFDNTLSDIDWESMIGCKFNQIGDIEFCKKYVPFVKERTAHVKGDQSLWKRRMRKLKKFNRIRDDQFAFHYDSKHLEDNIHYLSPDDIVSITVKVHGTSGIFANILCNKKLTRWEKVKKFFGFNVPLYEYGNVYSSRGVIKNKYINENAQSFYNVDIWGCVNRDFSPYISEGMTVYGEIVGYLEGSQTMIQKKHDYGCKTGCWKFMPYRITETDEFGNKVEWDIDKVDEWTRNLVAEHPELADKTMFLNILYYGRIGDLYPNLDTETHWHSNLLALMKADKENFLMEMDEPLCKNKVPREGIVIRKVGDPIARAWKLKTAKHYGKEAEAHDKGEVDIEEMESMGIE
jgi:hypothetical protein